MNSLLDHLYSYVFNRNLLFQDGWGETDAFEYLLKTPPETLHNRPVGDISIRWGAGRAVNGVCLREGVFESPFQFVWKNGGKTAVSKLPPETSLAHVELVTPRGFTGKEPVLLHFAASGDEGFARRRAYLALPLAARGIASLLLENPYYGRRRPNGQQGTVLKRFTELLQMSRAAADEGIALLRRLRADGYGPLGVSGISMGAYVSLSVAARSGLPLAVASFVPLHSASPVYTEGALSRACDWNALGRHAGSPEKARLLMRSIMDISDIRNLPIPVRPDAAILVSAEHDAYVPRHSADIIIERWKGATLRRVNTGHVGAFAFCRSVFCDAAVEAFARLR